MVADNIAKKRETSCGTHTSTAAEAAKHGRFRVMTLNCRYGRANAAAIVSAVKEHDVAVLALQELTDDLVAALDEAGLSDLLPYRQLGENKDTDNGGFNGIWIRIELKRHVADHRRDSRRRRAWRVLPALMRCAASLSFPPIRNRRCAAAATGPPASSAWVSWPHRRSRAISPSYWATSTPAPTIRASGKPLDAGFQDAALTEAKGRRATFPSWLPWPRLILDHILFTAGLTASDVRSFTVNGTDHLALAATLTLK